MMRALYSGVAGLKTHQTKMDVIGNNIANVNTTAFKSSSITFSELVNQTIQKASGANVNTGTGGTNARQIGLGVKSGAINVNISGQGSTQSTGNPFDLMITGSAMFVVNNGVENMYTRDGSFYVDGAGNLAMTSTGYNVMGWGTDAITGNISQSNVSALRIMSTANMTYPPEATTDGKVSGILDRNDKDATSIHGKIVNLNFYDSLGYPYNAKIAFKQSDDPNSYSVEFVGLQDSDGKDVDISGVEFGAQNSTQEIATSVGFEKTSYAWDSTVPTSTKLTSKDGKTIFADLSQILDANDKTKLASGDTVTTTPNYPADASGQTMYTVQEMLDNIAEAHGYEGATDSFLNLYTNFDDGTGTPKAVSVADMLVNAAAGGTTQPSFPLMGATTDNTATKFNETADTFQLDGRFYDGTTVSFNSGNGTFQGVGGIADQETVTLGLSSLGSNFKNIVMNLSEITSVNNDGSSTIGADTGDLDGLGTGRKLGAMIGVAVQNNGMLYASYDNGMTKLLGQIAVAEFANVSGLEKRGDNLYSETLNSGSFDGVGVDITANGGTMSSGQLEMSNVDLSSEFTEMITTQRGFQANSRIITVSDTLLEELTNLKR
jgi:flagellar hook protein FlgE